MLTAACLLSLSRSILAAALPVESSTPTVAPKYPLDRSRQTQMMVGIRTMGQVQFVPVSIMEPIYYEAINARSL